jgi:hypothetical protein
MLVVIHLVRDFSHRHMAHEDRTRSPALTLALVAAAHITLYGGAMMCSSALKP